MEANLLIPSQKAGAYPCLLRSNDFAVNCAALAIFLHWVLDYIHVAR